jgi:hypothetical protein
MFISKVAVKQSQSYITTDSQSASLSWCQALIWDPRPIFLFPSIFFRQLRVCYFMAPSLTRRKVCNLMLLLILVSTVPLWSDPHETQNHILLSQLLRLPQPGGSGPRIYISQEQGGPDIPPGPKFPFRRLLRLAGLRWRYSIPPPHGNAAWRSNSWFTFGKPQVQISVAEHCNACPLSFYRNYGMVL